MISPESKKFINRMTIYNMSTGLPKSMAHVLTYLSVCEPARQSAEDIQKVTKLSAGSISTAVTVFQRAGLVERSRSAHGRRYYYELDPDGWKRATMMRLKSLSVGVDLADAGLAIFPNNSRLVAMRNIYATFDEEFSGLAKRFTENT